MGYRINKKEIDLNKLQKIAQGKRGYVYRLEKNALKVLENEELNECTCWSTCKIFIRNYFIFKINHIVKNFRSLTN